MFYTVVDQVFVPNAQKVLGRVSRKTVVVGFARMLGEIADFLTPPRKAIWCVAVLLRVRISCTRPNGHLPLPPG